jgi:branched-chain amino acid transport system permease protein
MEMERRVNNGVWGTVVAGLNGIGFSPLGALGMLGILALPFVPPFDQEHLIRWLIAGAYLAAQAVAFDFTSGYIGVVNFGFAAFVGLGAYTSAILANDTPLLIVQTGLTPWIGIFVGALAAGVLGLGLGLLTLRLRGIFAACMAWFVGIALMGTALNLVPLTRGALGLHPPSLLEGTGNRPYFYVIMAMLLVTYVTLTLLTKTRMGLAFRAIGQNVDAARASGINPTRYKVINFTLSCMFAGWLGGFQAHFLSSLTPQTMMHTQKTVEVLTMVYIGGRGSMWGGLLVSFPFIFVINYLRSNFENLPGLHLVVFGVAMILVMIFYPGGASAAIESVAGWVRAILAGRREG